ncbi:unnamed protein product, partial [Closterium sp. NIES-54]
MANSLEDLEKTLKTSSQVHISGLHPSIDSHPPAAATAAAAAAALPIPPSARPSSSSPSTSSSPSLSTSPFIRPTDSAPASHSSLRNSTTFSLDRSSLTSLIGAHGKEPFLIGVSGGTASGKTTVCEQIIQQLHDHRVVLVHQVRCSAVRCKTVQQERERRWVCVIVESVQQLTIQQMHDHRVVLVHQ